MITIYCFTYVPDAVPTTSLLPAFKWGKKEGVKLESGSAESWTNLFYAKANVLLQL